MKTFFRTLALCAALIVPAATASAQQPTTVNPQASSVQERQLLDALKGGETVQGRLYPGSQVRHAHSAGRPRLAQIS